MGLVMALLAITIILFAFEILRVDVAAIVVMVLLGLSTTLPGIDAIIDRQDLFSGFSSNAVISVIAVMIIGAGLDKTGIMSKVASLILQKGGKTESRIIPLVSGTVAIISSFMQNIGAAALFLPVVSRISARTDLPMSRLLMPMGFCAILGGTVTMIGSSPLILLNDLLISANKTLPVSQQMDTFGLFSVTPIGLALVLAGIIYFILAGRFVLPHNSSSDGSRTSRAAEYFEKLYGIKGELMEVRVTDDSPQVGMTIHQVEENHPNTPMMLALYSGDVVKVPPDREEMIWVNTRIGLMGDRDQIGKYCEENHWELLGEPDRFADVLNAQHGGIAEIVIPPGSSLIGQSIGDIKPRRNFGTNILQIYRNEEVIKREFRDQKLHAGDTLVVHASWKDLKALSRNKDFVVATDVKYEDLRTNKIKEAVVFFCIALTLFLITDSLSISLLTGAVGMVLSGVLTIDEAYDAVSWQTVFLLASLIPLGIAVDQSGTAAWIAQQILALVGDVPTFVLQVVIALLATFFTLVMSNIGATVLLVPLAVNIAVAVGADPAVFALTVAISTSNSFLIPTHQVNALLMGPGGYQVADFMRAGGIMTVLFLIVSILMLNLVM
jgi:di/tricarboxylate transporter